MNARGSRNVRLGLCEVTSRDNVPNGSSGAVSGSGSVVRATGDGQVETGDVRDGDEFLSRSTLVDDQGVGSRAREA